MYTISAVINKLSKFSDIDNISEIIFDLKRLNTLSDDQDEIIEKLRGSLKNFFLQSKEKKDKQKNSTFHRTIYKALSALAEFRSINSTDPITMDVIASGDRVVVSTGHQFSISALIEYHNARIPRDSLDETTTNKWLLNPLDNDKFDYIDVVHIKTFAKQKSIKIQHLNPESFLQNARSSHGRFAFFKSGGIAIALASLSYVSEGFSRAVPLYPLIRR